MNVSSPTEPRATAATWLGLFVALFAILLVRWGVACFWPPYSLAATVLKESLIWVCVIALLLIVTRGERLPLRSINPRPASLWKSILWGLLLTVLCGAVGATIARLIGFKGGEMAAALMKLPVWLVILVVLRAGVVEELFYRGYAIDRLQRLGLNRWMAGLIPLLIFGFAHGANGWANVAIALALGAVLTAFYLWRRDLLANIIGHFLVDFIGVVLPRLLSHHQVNQ